LQAPKGALRFITVPTVPRDNVFKRIPLFLLLRVKATVSGNQESQMPVAIPRRFPSCLFTLCITSGASGGRSKHPSALHWLAPDCKHMWSLLCTLVAVQTAMATRDATSSEVHRLDIAPVTMARAVEMREEDRIRAHRDIQRAALADLRVVADNARRREREELDLGRNEELIQHRGDTYQ
jgi:hypothetical protein